MKQASKQARKAMKVERKERKGKKRRGETRKCELRRRDLANGKLLTWKMGHNVVVTMTTKRNLTMDLVGLFSRKGKAHEERIKRGTN